MRPISKYKLRIQFWSLPPRQLYKMFRASLTQDFGKVLSIILIKKRKKEKKKRRKEEENELK